MCIRINYFFFNKLDLKINFSGIKITNIAKTKEKKNNETKHIIENKKKIYMHFNQ